MEQLSNSTLPFSNPKIRDRRRFTADDVVGLLQYLFAVRGTSTHTRSDSGPECVARRARDWLEKATVQTLFIAKGNPSENGEVESFNGRLHDELLNRERFFGLEEAPWVIDHWKLDCNHHRNATGRTFTRLETPTKAPILPDFMLNH